MAEVQNLETRARQVLRADVLTRGPYVVAMHDEDAIVNIGTAVSAMLAYAASEPTHEERVAYEGKILALEITLKRMTNYRGWSISFDYPPIPCRGFDWSATHPDYDGAEDANDGRIVRGHTREAVIAQIDAWFEEQAA